MLVTVHKSVSAKICTICPLKAMLQLLYNTEKVVFTLKIQKGDAVIYGNFDLCSVKDKTLMSFTSDAPKESYIVLSPNSSPMSTYYIPEKNADSQLRLPLTVQEITLLLERAKKLNTKWIDNRQLRSDSFRSVLSKGVSPELISLLFCLYQRREQLNARGKALSSTDEIFFSTAEKLLQEEFSYSLKINRDSVNSYICRFFESDS